MVVDLGGCRHVSLYVLQLHIFGSVDCANIPTAVKCQTVGQGDPGFVTWVILFASHCLCLSAELL